MEIRIQLQDCEVEYEHFVKEWNAHSDTADVGSAAFNDNSTSEPVAGARCIETGAIVLSIASGIAASAIYDLIKATIQRLRPGISSGQIQTAPTDAANSSGDLEVNVVVTT